MDLTLDKGKHFLITYYDLGCPLKTLTTLVGMFKSH